MSQVVVAASIRNELRSEDITAVKKLQFAGDKVQLYYYLPQVPAEYTMLRSMNERIIEWKIRGKEKLNAIGNELNLPPENRHFVDEILGPDKVFDDAKALRADVIITHNPKELKQRFLSRMLDRVSSLFTRASAGKEVVTESVTQYAQERLGAKEVAEGIVTRPRTSPSYAGESKKSVHTSSVWTKQSEDKLRGRTGKQEEIDKDQEDVQEQKSHLGKRK